MSTADYRPRVGNVLCRVGWPLTIVATFAGVDLSAYTASVNVIKAGSEVPVLTASVGSGITITYDTPSATSTVTITWNLATMTAVAPGAYSWELKPALSGAPSPAVSIRGSFKVDGEFDA